MPIYQFEDTKTGLKVEVLRSHTDYKVPPTDDELPEEERGKERDWIKLISAGIKAIYYPNSTGSVKGRP
jgi:hypothetical protein